MAAAESPVPNMACGRAGLIIDGQVNGDAGLHHVLADGVSRGSGHICWAALKMGPAHLSHLAESNRRPADYESAALPTELRWHGFVTDFVTKVNEKTPLSGDWGKGELALIAV